MVSITVQNTVERVELTSTGCISGGADVVDIESATGKYSVETTHKTISHPPTLLLPIKKKKPMALVSWNSKTFVGFATALVVPILLAVSYQRLLFAGLAPPPPEYGSGTMFDKIANRYDFINRVLALSLDISWRQRMVDEIANAFLQQQQQTIPKQPQILDLATGTADVAILLARTIPNAIILGIDPSRNMLAVARNKIQALQYQERIHLQHLDAQDLHIHADDTFDAATMAFGIRNVPNRSKALCEIQRVLKPNARFAILEFSEPDTTTTSTNTTNRYYYIQIVPLLAAKVFIRYMVPFLGGILSGKPREYWHLQNSIQEFPNPQQFAKILTTLECESSYSSSDGRRMMMMFHLENLIQLNFQSVQIYVLSKTLKSKPTLDADDDSFTTTTKKSHT
jgi:demethylmenaquinone methyltransferase/2-methoxy-6-polyprenyl-1,4-benzoquinol methylase